MDWMRLIEGILVGYLFYCTFRTFGVRRRVALLERRVNELEDKP